MLGEIKEINNKKACLAQQIIVIASILLLPVAINLSPTSGKGPSDNGLEIETSSLLVIAALASVRVALEAEPLFVAR
jgi:hypothetical protein